VEIDPTQRMADIDRSNNTFEGVEKVQVFSDPTK
jgi:hypothetical protein